MLNALFWTLSWLIAVLALVFTLRAACSQAQPTRSYLAWLTALGLCALGYGVTPPWPPAETVRMIPPLLGQRTALELGLLAQTRLPPSKPRHRPISWLQQTQGGRKVTHKPIVVFAQPDQARFRRERINRYFDFRFGWRDALNTAFEPSFIIVHSTEGEDENHAFEIFNRNTPAQYLGGVWTHFSVAPNGQIYQYGPLNRISKGQAGLDDSAVGIEIVGDASLWQKDVYPEQQTKTGSIISRYRAGQTLQLEAVADLIATLQQHYQIPLKHVYSHEDLGNVLTRRGAFPDFAHLRQQIRDRVYLNSEPSRNQKLEPEQWYGFLAPYDRQDPGRDVMQLLYQRLQL